MTRHDSESWGNSRHLSHHHRAQTADILSAAADLPVKPYEGTPPRNLNSIPPQQRKMIMNPQIIDVIEYRKPGRNMVVRADVIGGGIDQDGVYLTVIPTDVLVSGRWYKTLRIDTAFQIAADLVIGLDK